MERVGGVREAEFSYTEGVGTVTFDTTMTSVESIVAELERMTAFSAAVRGESHE